MITFNFLPGSTLESIDSARVMIEIESSKSFMAASVYGQNRLVRVDAHAWSLVDVLGVGDGIDRPIGVHYHQGYLYTTVTVGASFNSSSIPTKSICVYQCLTPLQMSKNPCYCI